MSTASTVSRFSTPTASPHTQLAAPPSPPPASLAESQPGSLRLASVLSNFDCACGKTVQCAVHVRLVRTRCAPVHVATLAREYVASVDRRCRSW